MNFLPHLIIFVAGCIILWIMKKKYKEISNLETITIFILMVLLIALFTENGIALVKRLMDFIQLE
jgi:hypothetical protein